MLECNRTPTRETGTTRVLECFDQPSTRFKNDEGQPRVYTAGKRLKDRLFRAEHHHHQRVTAARRIPCQSALYMRADRDDVSRDTGFLSREGYLLASDTRYRREDELRREGSRYRGVISTRLSSTSNTKRVALVKTGKVCRDKNDMASRAG